MSIDRPRLFLSFLEKGFMGLVNDEPRRLSAYLDERARDTGHAYYAFLSQAILKFAVLSEEHEEAGGLRAGFIRKVDQLVFNNLRSIEHHEPKEAAAIAMEFRTEVLRRVALYNVKNSYGE